MISHRQIAQEACEKLSRMDGISKVLLFGSVARRDERKDSDIDIAIILDDTLRGFPLDFEGLPPEVMERGSQIAEETYQKYGIKLDICPFWEDKYKKGIRLFGDKYLGSDLLNSTGIVMYDVLE